MRHSILCVDDEIHNVEALERLFRKKYDVFTALSGQQALEVIQKQGKNISLIISDQRMPHMEGTEFLKRSIEHIPDAIRILLTGFTDIGSVVSAINSGEVFRYITKPWDPVDLINTVDKAIERFEISIELKNTNQALRESLEELKGLDRAKTQFLYLINHELKTPLTVLDSFLNLLTETSLNSEQKKYVSHIKSSCKRLQRIIEDVLQLSSAEMGLLPIYPQPIDVKKFFTQVMSKYKHLASEKSIDFHAHTPQEDIRVQADEITFKKVLSLLLDNAVKFGDPFSTIEYGIRCKDSVGEIYICNSGETLDKTVIENILKTFTLHEDMMNHSKGLGLGLSLCQALLKRSGSELNINSVDKKITVSFHFPICSL